MFNKIKINTNMKTIKTKNMMTLSNKTYPDNNTK